MYKVVTAGELGSACVREWAQVWYEPGEWVTAQDWLARHGYHLTVFSSLETARIFKHNLRFPDKYEIWEVEVDGIVPLPPPLEILGLSHHEFRESRPDHWWEDTVMARRVKLSRRIEWVENGRLYQLP